MVSDYEGAIKKCKFCKSETKTLTRRVCCLTYICFSCALLKTAKYKTQCPSCKRDLNPKQTVFTVNQQDLVHLITQIEVGLMNARQPMTVKQLFRPELEIAAPSPFEAMQEELQSQDWQRIDLFADEVPRFFCI